MNKKFFRQNKVVLGSMYRGFSPTKFFFSATHTPFVRAPKTFLYTKIEGRFTLACLSDFERFCAKPYQCEEVITRHDLANFYSIACGFWWTLQTTTSAHVSVLDSRRSLPKSCRVWFIHETWKVNVGLRKDTSVAFFGIYVSGNKTNIN